MAEPYTKNPDVHRELHALKEAPTLEQIHAIAWRLRQTYGDKTAEEFARVAAQLSPKVERAEDRPPLPPPRQDRVAMKGRILDEGWHAAAREGRLADDTDPEVNAYQQRLRLEAQTRENQQERSRASQKAMEARIQAADRGDLPMSALTERELEVFNSATRETDPWLQMTPEQREQYLIQRAAEDARSPRTPGRTSGGGGAEGAGASGGEGGAPGLQRVSAAPGRKPRQGKTTLDPRPAPAPDPHAPSDEDGLLEKGRYYLNKLKGLEGEDAMTDKQVERLNKERTEEFRNPGTRVIPL